MKSEQTRGEREKRGERGEQKKQAASLERLVQKSAEEPKRVITDSEKEFLIQRQPEFGVRKAHVDLCAEEDDDEVDQIVQWCLEMLPGTQEQHQMIAQVFRCCSKKEEKLRD